ncbi:hypothetical protein ACOSP7_004145 [Xanthoceras sorbifolium]
MLMHKGIPVEVRWLIEVEVRLAGELFDSFVAYMPGLGKSNFAKKQRAKRLGLCYNCAHMTCNTRCRSLGMVSVNREDKMRFIKVGLSKESLDNVLMTVETHPSGYVHIAILTLWTQFLKEHERFNLGNLTLKSPVCQFIRKLDGKPILNP